MFDIFGLSSALSIHMESIKKRGIGLMYLILIVAGGCFTVLTYSELPKCVGFIFLMVLIVLRAIFTLSMFQF